MRTLAFYLGTLTATPAGTSTANVVAGQGMAVVALIMFLPNLVIFIFLQKLGDEHHVAFGAEMKSYYWFYSFLLGCLLEGGRRRPYPLYNLDIGFGRFSFSGSG